MLPSLIVLDNFLSNPAAARQQALSLPYPTDGSKGNYAGTASSKLLQIANISQAISRHLNTPVDGAYGTLHMHCRLTLKADRGRTGVHIDPCF